jgi:hypothetical protein
MINISCYLNIKHIMATFTIEGTIQFKTVEGGFWAMIDSQNKKWRFTNLPTSFQQEGLVAKLTVKLVDEAVSFIMWGKPVEVVL